MISRTELEKLARRRWEPGKGPWSKVEDLDQVDLVHLERIAGAYAVDSSDKGLLASCLKRLCEEVRAAREWPTPKDEPHTEQTSEERFKEILIQAEGDPEDDHLFQSVICRSLALGLFSGERDLGQKFGVSATLVERWKQGLSLPIVAARKAVYWEVRLRSEG